MRELLRLLGGIAHQEAEMMNAVAAFLGLFFLPVMADAVV